MAYPNFSQLELAWFSMVLSAISVPNIERKLLTAHKFTVTFSWSNHRSCTIKSINYIVDLLQDRHSIPMDSARDFIAGDAGQNMMLGRDFLAQLLYPSTVPLHGSKISQSCWSNKNSLGHTAMNYTMY